MSSLDFGLMLYFSSVPSYETTTSPVWIHFSTITSQSQTLYFFRAYGLIFFASIFSTTFRGSDGKIKRPFSSSNWFVCIEKLTSFAVGMASLTIRRGGRFLSFAGSARESQVADLRLIFPSKGFP
jgi:hypothetical protein